MYLKHLFQTQEILGLRLLSFHNLWFYGQLMAAIGRAIEKDALGNHEELKGLRERLSRAYQPTLEEINR